MLNQEFAFTLPKGLVNANGEILRQGKMRSATGKDEFWLQNHSLIQESPEYRILAILSRVITSLGNLPLITPELLEQLFLVDFLYLQQLYYEINQFSEVSLIEGELWATPWNSFTKR